MKKFIIYLVIGWITIAFANAQEKKVISSDSLLKLFQIMEPFDVLDKLDYENMDFKTFYYDIRLKQKLMKWLDRDDYFQYTIERVRNNITNNPQLIKEEIQYLLTKQGKKNALDSVLNAAILYSQYRDSAITVYVNRYINGRGGQKQPVPDKAVLYHSLLAYPESYLILKQWWRESIETMDSPYFIALIRLGDLHARRLYDNKIKEFVKNSNDNTLMYEIDSELAQFSNSSYAIEKMIELLKIDKMYYLGPDGEPYNCFILSNIVDKIFYNSIQVAPSIKRNDPCNIHLKHLSLIKVATQKMIDKYKASELYWLKNMPFYKNSVDN